MWFVPRLLVTILVGCCSLTAVAGAHAAAGDLDPGFSSDGKQNTDFGVPGTQGFDVALQSDGKIVAVGTTAFQDFAVTRLNADGSLDSSFSDDGKLTTDFGTGGGEESANGVALQPDGKIVVVGESGAAVWAIARYNPDGSLDTTFSGDGKATTDFGAGQDIAYDVGVQADGKIVVAGETNVTDFALARFNTDGSLDTSFSSDGVQITDFAGGQDAGYALVLQPDGKAVVAGTAGFQDFALARYNVDGSLDTSFSGDGKQTTDLGGSDDEAMGLALQSNGAIVAVGSTGDGVTSMFALARYLTDGSLDPTFSSDGKQTTSFSVGADSARDVVVQGGIRDSIAVGIDRRRATVGGARRNRRTKIACIWDTVAVRVRRGGRGGSEEPSHADPDPRVNSAGHHDCVVRLHDHAVGVGAAAPKQWRWRGRGGSAVAAKAGVCRAVRVVARDGDEVFEISSARDDELNG